MIANFFQNLDRLGVKHLLISGQATVAYGAANFSEDIDLWVDPGVENCERFISVLRDCRACYYKLTPPFSPTHLLRGHGFHFILSGGSETEVFLDVMGKPPRVGSFSSAAVSARNMDTEWGPIPTIGLKDLVELKKTQRLEDYAIISNLALLWFEQPECAQHAEDFQWALENTFTLMALKSLLDDHPVAVQHAVGEYAADVRELARYIAIESEAPEAVEKRLVNQMQRRMAFLQEQDRMYWRSIIAELKSLRIKGKLEPEGAAV